MNWAVPLAVLASHASQSLLDDRLTGPSALSFAVGHKQGQLAQLFEHTIAGHLSAQPNNNRTHTHRTSTSSHKHLLQTISTANMSAAIQTKSIDVHFKLKEGKKYPKTVDLEKLKEHYGEGNVLFEESKNKHFSIQVKKVCYTVDQMKEELWPVLEETEIFKTWEAERIMVWHADNSCLYLKGDPYPGK
ncbi:hypothetical protein H9Q72_003603 [Fusarium xylarioides]|uniref:Uncharacterized protein n=1 Tax=Fusarium xylarioides TaxID=221167 RepID=A0A9P7HZG3_9HYPO|nr:hypothetical protein H9Q72_003603 [Fusarium xylarioides]